MAELVFNDAIIPDIVEGYCQYMQSQNGESVTEINRHKKRLTAVVGEISNIVNVIAKTGSESLISRLGELEGEKAEIEYRLHKIKEEEKVCEISENYIIDVFHQGRHHSKRGDLPTIKQLVERIVNKVMFIKTVLTFLLI